jgi:hypothetical protein
VIRFFDAAGKFVGSAGRQGQGPGEFQQVMGTRVIRGDTVVVSDLGQVEYFSSDGRFARQGASRTRMPEYAFPWIVMRDGTYLSVAYRMNVIPSAGRSRRISPILHVTQDGAQVDSIGLLQRGEEVYDGRQPFGGQVVFSAASTLAADNRRFLVSATDRAEIAEHTLSGRLTRVIRLPHPRRPVTDEAREAYRAYVKAMPGEDGRPMPPAMRARFDQMLERATFAREFSPFGNMIVDAAGHLWVQHYDYRSVFQTPGPVRTQTLPVPSRWDVVDLTGRWLCTVELPSRFTPSEIGVDYVAGMARDEDDVERVEVYRLRKP